MMLRHAVLEVCVDSTVQQALSLCIAVGDEGVVHKLSIVGMIMQYFFTLRCSAESSKACFAITVSSLMRHFWRYTNIYPEN